MVTHPYYADYFDKIELQNNQPLNMGIINMLSKIKLLEEVIVKTGSPIRVKGDTTIFTADSFKVREGANVEELLRKLPGIQVDRSGAITAMGEKVKNVLVDGEEFFGNDPGIATKNLRADAVKEVEVYDKKSDQATFTGIDDGQKEKTINLKLKDDKKKGYFGKIELGGGLKDKFNNSVMVNAFKAKRKIAAYGIMSNTGTLNLNWEDSRKYSGDSPNIEMSDDGGMMFWIGGDDYNQSSGIPTNWNAGVHYSNKFNEDKQSLNVGYKMVKINAPGYIETLSRNFLPDSSWNTKSINNSFSTNVKHNINFTYETKIDSMNTLKFVAKGNLNNTKSNYNFYSESLSDKNLFINKNNRFGSSETDNSNANSNLLWMHKFKKQYRTISINAGFNITNADANSFTYSKLVYYKNGDSTGNKVIDQNTLADNKSLNYNAKAAYTEPLMKDVYLELSYAFGKNKNNNDREVFAKGMGNNYNQRIDSLSNEYEFNYLSHTPGINFKMNKKKLSISIGTSTGFTNYQQIDVTKHIFNDYNFANHHPRARISYKFKPWESLSFDYNGNTRAPSLNQLQPIRDNTDLLNIYLGNPNLRPSFNHRFSVSFNSYKMLKERGIWSWISYSNTQNAFVQFSEFKDSVRTYYTVNTNGVYSINGNLYFDKRIKSKGLSFGFGPNFNINRSIDFVKDNKTNVSVKNMTNSSSYGLSISFGKDIPDKLNISIRPNVAYNKSKASVNTSANAEYWSGGYNVWGNWEMGKDFSINTDVDANYVQSDPRFSQNNNYTIWNASISKKFHKKEFEVRAGVNDILDQNRGYNRNFNSYSFTETYRTTLRRFWLVSFIWNITKNGAAPAN